jgi:hypothetical protein
MADRRPHHLKSQPFASSLIVLKSCSKNVVFRVETLETKNPETTNSRD